ncbi:MAG: hypothetical protein CM1200mP30_30310 [Pseudomonadota bacterium]|nr:MAG: hypothetical protein CM1200mP30_30310 [Pseudomonadota bacterium]
MANGQRSCRFTLVPCSCNAHDSGRNFKLAKSGAVAGLCPVTEANLGDGIFNGSEYVSSRGKYGIGSDSNVRISLTEELGCLSTVREYSGGKGM